MWAWLTALALGAGPAGGGPAWTDGAGVAFDGDAVLLPAVAPDRGRPAVTQGAVSLPATAGGDGVPCRHGLVLLALGGAVTPGETAVRARAVARLTAPRTAARLFGERACDRVVAVLARADDPHLRVSTDAAAWSDDLRATLRVVRRPPHDLAGALTRLLRDGVPLARTWTGHPARAATLVVVEDADDGCARWSEEVRVWVRRAVARHGLRVLRVGEGCADAPPLEPPERRAWVDALVETPQPTVRADAWRVRPRRGAAAWTLEVRSQEEPSTTLTVWPARSVAWRGAASPAGAAVAVLGELGAALGLLAALAWAARWPWRKSGSARGSTPPPAG